MGEAGGELGAQGGGEVFFHGGQRGLVHQHPPVVLIFVLWVVVPFLFFYGFVCLSVACLFSWRSAWACAPALRHSTNFYLFLFNFVFYLFMGL